MEPPNKFQSEAEYNPNLSFGWGRQIGPNLFENEFLNQKLNENRDFNTTLDIAWNILSVFPENMLFRIHQKYIEKYYEERR